MATIMKPVDPTNAPGEVKAIFDDIMASRNVNDVNNFWKYLANEPRMLRHTWESLKDIMAPGALDPLVKELIYVAVSVTNNCDYCMASHTAAARAKGATEAQLNELYAVVALANMTNRLANAYKVPIDEAFKETE
ncbi:MAG: carboxymuconolactone decarboxylase family protein [Hyphomicrobiaceae bacterium]